MFISGIKNARDAKFIVIVNSNKKTHDIKIESVYDNRTHRDLSQEEIFDYGLRDFTYKDLYGGDNTIYRTSTDELKEDLNWMLNGDESKYKFKWGQSGKETSMGMAFVFA